MSFRSSCELSLLTALFCVLGCSDRTRLDLFAPEPADASRLDADVADGSEPSIDAAADAAAAVDAGPRLPGLVLRYDFSGQGSELLDRVGSAHARVLGGATLDDAGGLTLDGIDDYVDLPNRTLAQLRSVTLMTWLRWAGGVCWQRVFDFGRNDVAEGQQGYATASLFLTLSTCPEGTVAVFAELGNRKFTAISKQVLTEGSALQLTVTFDATSALLTLYLDGTRLAEQTATFALSELDEDNAWLGRSQWIQDRFARIRYDEFRLYDRALDAGEVSDAVERGPDRP